MGDVDRRARHVPVEDRPEVRLFAAELKRLFDSLDMSLGLFCKTNPNIDKGALSRYLNGKRVPRDRWFLDRLFALRVEAGTPLADEARDHLIALQLVALQVAHPQDYRVRQVTDELNDTVTALRESRRHITSMEQELADRTRQLADLTAANIKLRTAWDTERLTTQRTIADLITQLALARNNHANAEERQRKLENLLDQLDSTDPEAPGNAASSAGSRFPAAIEGLEASLPHQRTAAIHELSDIAQETPALHEAVIGILLGHLRGTAPTLKDTFPFAPRDTFLPATTHLTEPLHAAIQALLQLNGLQLPRANLKRADLRGVKLVGADLNEADLIGANLTRADLIGADLTRADLTRAELPGADLTRADLTEANLTEANPTRANLRCVKLIGANLTGADLTEANLTEADLTEANLRGADLAGANLTEANLTEADLRGADLRGADLAGADLRGANLTEANLTEANLARANLARANLTEANLRGVKLIGANLIGAELTRAKLFSADLFSANLNGANLNGTDLNGANLNGANLNGIRGTSEAEVRMFTRTDSWTRF